MTNQELVGACQRQAASEGSLYMTVTGSLNADRSQRGGVGVTKEWENMSARERAVGEVTGVLIE